MFSEFFTKEVMEKISKTLTGEPLSEAVNFCVYNNIEYRTVREDDKKYIITMDMHPNRLNFEVDSGIVTKVSCY